MANEKQLAILRRGAGAWSQWRAEHSSEKIDLGGADLGGADLITAHLGRADLGGADLIAAFLGRADLSGANLVMAHLGGADLSGADLHEVLLGETVLGNTNLAGAKGLDTCEHVAPSTIDHRTLARSGPLPLAFLRGVGLPDRLIDDLP